MRATSVTTGMCTTRGGTQKRRYAIAPTEGTVGTTTLCVVGITGRGGSAGARNVGKRKTGTESEATDGAKPGCSSAATIGAT